LSQKFYSKYKSVFLASQLTKEYIKNSGKKEDATAIGTNAVVSTQNSFMVKKSRPFSYSINSKTDNFLTGFKNINKNLPYLQNNKTNYKSFNKKHGNNSLGFLSSNKTNPINLKNSFTSKFNMNPTSDFMKTTSNFKYYSPNKSVRVS